MIATLQKPTIENDGSSFVDMDSIPKIVSKSGPQKPRTGIILALVVLVLISAGGLTYWVLAKTSASSTADSPSVAVPTATAVRIFVVGSRNSKPASQSLTGVIRARHEVQLAFRVGGKINKRHVEVGQVVAKGDLLFELEPEDFDLQVQQTARANLEVAKAAVQRWIAEEKRLQELLRINAVSPSEYEKGLADRDSALGLRQSAEKQLELATNQLGYCRLVADERRGDDIDRSGGRSSRGGRGKARKFGSDQRTRSRYRCSRKSLAESREKRNEGRILVDARPFRCRRNFARFRRSPMLPPGRFVLALRCYNHRKKSSLV